MLLPRRPSNLFDRVLEKKPRKIRTYKNSFTLIELLIGLFILVVVFTVIYNVVLVSSRGTISNNMQMERTMYIEVDNKQLECTCYE